MKVDPYDPTAHGKPVWIVFGASLYEPQITCVRLEAYDERWQRLPIGANGYVVCMWGYSVFGTSGPGFRTLGMSVEKWMERSSFEPSFFDVQDEALTLLREMTTPRGCL